MSIYTDNDRLLCCPLCGDARLRLGGLRSTVGESAGGFATRLSCSTCRGDFELVFTAGPMGTRVTFMVLTEDVAALDLARYAYLADPDTETERTA